MTARVDDDDFTLVAEPRRSARGRRRRGRRRWAWLGFLFRRPARTIAGAIVSALLTGIVVNALVLQKEKHPAPLFVPAETPKAPVAQARPAPLRQAHGAAVEPAETRQKDSIAVLLQPSGPDKPAAPAAAKPRDPIGQLIRGNGAAKSRRQVTSPRSADAIAALIGENAPAAAVAPAPPPAIVAGAQRALVKLGFVLRADGVPGSATRRAVEMFERDHGLPADGDLSPGVLRRLAELSGVAIP